MRRRFDPRYGGILTSVWDRRQSSLVVYQSERLQVGVYFIILYFISFFAFIDWNFFYIFVTLINWFL